MACTVYSRLTNKISYDFAINSLLSFIISQLNTANLQICDSDRARHMKEKLETIIKYIIGADKGDKTLSKINIPEQFQPGAEDNNAIAKNLNAGFLIILSGKSHPLYNQAFQYLDSLKAHSSWEKAEGWGLFYDILDTVEEKLKKGDDFATELQKKARNMVKKCKINFKG